ncbi:MAG: glycogen synthase [bacterium]
MSSKIKVLFATAELAPLAKVGGLADVAGALPPALYQLGVDVRIIIPKYGFIDEKKYRLKKILAGLEVEFEKSKHLVNLYQTVLPKTKIIVYLIDNKHYLGHGGVYVSADAAPAGTKSEFERFGFFSLAILEVLKNMRWQPQIIHGNDWHVGLLPRLIKLKKLNIKTLTTIHNLAYQGWYNENLVARALGYKKSFFSPIKNYIITLKEAILASDLLNTVSPSYAKEILTAEFGCGLGADLQKRKESLFGILNGIDTALFNPATDKLIKEKYNLKNLKRKLLNKIYLQKICRLPQDEKIPLLGIVGRLTEQKGFDLLLPIFEDLMKKNLQLVILAIGNKNFEKGLANFSQKYPDKLSFQPRFDLKLAQQIYAGADFFLMPSRFEPCGLGQMIAMRYGTVPIVRAVGGLKDTVINFNPSIGGQNLKANGFSFKNYASAAFYKTTEEALNVYYHQPKIWRKLQANSMTQDFSWQTSAQKYLKLYRKLI